MGTRKARTGFVLNVSRGTMHRLPTQEQCNLDQVPGSHRRYLATVVGVVYRRRCAYCFPDWSSR